MSSIVLLRRRKEIFFDDIKITIDKDRFFLGRSEKIEIELSEGEHTILIESYWCKKSQAFEVRNNDLELVVERARYKYYIAGAITVLLLLFLPLIINVQQRWLFTSGLFFYYIFLMIDMLVYRNKFFNIRISSLPNKEEPEQKRYHPIN